MLRVYVDMYMYVLIAHVLSVYAQPWLVLLVLVDICDHLGDYPG